MRSKATRKDTFAPDREAKQATREELIAKCLEEVNASGAVFEFITDLAEFVASYITAAQSKQCVFGTLLRNRRYKRLLQDHQNAVRLPGTKHLPDSVVESPAAKALLDRYKQEAANLRHENERLKAFCAQLTSLSAHPVEITAPVEARKDIEYVNDFILTCQALRNVMDHSDGMYELDPDSLEIVDGSNRFLKRVVARRELAEPFAKWCNSNFK